MKEDLKKYIETIKSKYPDSFIKIEEFRDELTLEINKKDTYDILQHLKDSKESAFDYLVDIIFVDHLKIGGKERYAVYYQLHSYTYVERMRVKVWVSEEDMTLKSIIPIWKSANWLEREVWDLCGIKFDGHPDLRRLVMPDTYKGHPLRKDYPLQGEGFREDFPNLKADK